MLLQSQVNELKEQVSRLEQNLKISEDRNTCLKEEISCHVKSNKETTTDVASDKVTDEVSLYHISLIFHSIHVFCLQHYLVCSLLNVLLALF